MRLTRKLQNSDSHRKFKIISRRGKIQESVFNVKNLKNLGFSTAIESNFLMRN